MTVPSASAVRTGRGRRAKHGRGRRPRVYAGLVPLVTVVLAAGLGVASAHGSRVFGAGVLAVQLVIVFGWWRAASVPGWAVGAPLAAALAVGVDAALVLGDDDPWVAVAAGVAVAVVVAVAHQLLRRRGRPAATASLAVTVAGAILVALGAAWLAAWDAHLGEVVVETSLAGVGATALMTALAAPLRPPPAALAASAIMAAALAGAAVSVTAEGFDGTSGLALGAVGGLFAAGAHAAGAHATATGYGRLTFAAALPLITAAPAAYLVGRLITG